MPKKSVWGGPRKNAGRRPDNPADGIRQKISITVPPKQLDQWREIADQKQISVSVFVTRSMKKFLEKSENFEQDD